MFSQCPWDICLYNYYSISCPLCKGRVPLASLPTAPPLGRKTAKWSKQGVVLDKTALVKAILNISQLYK